MRGFSHSRTTQSVRSSSSSYLGLSALVFLLSWSCHRAPVAQLGPPTPPPTAIAQESRIGEAVTRNRHNAASTAVGRTNKARAKIVAVAGAGASTVALPRTISEPVPAAKPVPEADIETTPVPGLRVFWRLTPEYVDWGKPGVSIHINPQDPSFVRWLLDTDVVTGEQLLRIPGGGDICNPACHLIASADSDIQFRVREPALVKNGYDIFPERPISGDLHIYLSPDNYPLNLEKLWLVKLGAEPTEGFSFPILVPKNGWLLGRAEGPWEMTAGQIKGHGQAGQIAINLGSQSGEALRVAFATSRPIHNLRLAVPKPKRNKQRHLTARRVVVVVAGGVRSDRLPTAFPELVYKGTVVQGLTAPTTDVTRNLIQLLGNTAGRARYFGFKTALFSSERRINKSMDFGFETVVHERPKHTEAEEKILARAAQWLAAQGNRRAFLVVVIPSGDPPHFIRDGITRQYDPEDYHGVLGQNLSEWRLNKVKKGQVLLAPRDIKRLKALYDTDVAHLAAQLKAKLPIDNKTAFVLTSSHGYELFEHGSVHFGHSVHRESVELPLAIVAPSIIGGRRLKLPIGVEAVLPAVLALAGVEPQETRGIRLVEALRDGQAMFQSHAISRMSNRVSMFQLGRWRLIRRGSFSENYFDLKNDPQELHPIRKPHASVRALLRDRLLLEMGRHPL